MLNLSRRSGKSVHLSMLDEADVIYIDKVEGGHPVRAYSRIGGRAPAYAVATGKVLLAFRDDVDDILPQKLERFTEHTARSRVILMKELNKIRRRRYAINVGEWREGVGGLATAILNSRGEVVAAIGISGPTSRLTSERLNSLALVVVASADEISRQCGCSTLKEVGAQTPVESSGRNLRPLAKRSYA